MSRSCRWCRRPVLVQRRDGQYVSMKDHDLCDQCWRKMLAKKSGRHIPPPPRRGPQVPMPELLDPEEP